MGWLRKLMTAIGLGPASEPDDVDSAHDDEAMAEAVRIEVGPELDLHPFSPKDTRDVVDAYLREAHAKGLHEVRIVHGRGKGVQRRIIRALLETHPLVASYRDSLPSGGGWGATVAVLKPPA